MVDKRTASFVQGLCMGRIEEEIVLPYPQLNPAEKETLRQVLTAVNQLLAPHERDFRAWDVKGEMPREFIDELKQFGLFGLVVPEEHGGLGFGSAAYSRALQEISKHDASVALTVGAHSSIGMRGLLLFGTDAQKRKYMPRLATGELIAAFCLTEPGAGSDAAAVRTTAVRHGDHWILNGDKLWITNGGIADFFTVFAKTPEVQKNGKAQMTAFIVTRDMPGVSVGAHEDKMGIRASSTTTVHFEDVKVPDENVLGELGMGFKTAMRILNSGRTGLGGGCVGGMKRLIALATKQAKERKQFGRSIAEFGLVKQKLGEMVVECYASEAVVGLVAGIVDQGYQDYAVEAAISKVFATEALWRTADEALQIAGGIGYMRELPYERVVRDSRINRIFEGTNEILRLFIALTAMNEVSAELRELAQSLKGVLADPIKGFGVMSDYAKRVAAIRAPGPLADRFGDRLAEKLSWTKLHPALGPTAEHFEEATRELAWVADRVLRRHGRQIVEKQFALRRIADILIDLFVLAAVMSRVNSALQSEGEEKSAREFEVLRVFARRARGRIRGNLRRVDVNDDELVKSLADDAFDVEGYRWDLV